MEKNVIINIFNFNSTDKETSVDKIDDYYEYEGKDEYEEYFKYAGINLKYTNRENKTIVVCTEKKNIVSQEDKKRKLINIIDSTMYNKVIETFKYKFWFLRVFDSKPKLFVKWLKEQKESCSFNKFFIDCL